MSLWGRLRRRARRIVDRFTEPAEPEPRPQREPEPSPRREPEPAPEPPSGGLPSTPDDSRLPPGWVVVGLYHEGEKTQRIYATDDRDVTDGEIQGADAIIVQYVDAGGDGYRWIHGATGWDSIHDQINRTIKVVSPAGSGN